MLCLALALILLAQVTHPMQTAHATSSPLVATLDRIFEKLERLTVAPNPISTPKTVLSDDEEEVLSAIRTWGGLSQAQLDGVAKNLQRMRAEADEDRSDLDYTDMDDNDEEYTDIEYHNDAKDGEDEDIFTVDSRDSGTITVAKALMGVRGDAMDDDDEVPTMGTIKFAKVLKGSARGDAMDDDDERLVIGTKILNGRIRGDPMDDENEGLVVGTKVLKERIRGNGMDDENDGRVVGAKALKGRIRGIALNDDDESSVVTQRLRVTPSELTRGGPSHRIVSAVASIAATNERPRVLDDSGMTAVDRKALKRAALDNLSRVVRESKCLVPQPRWLSVRQLAPASDTMYLPPCVELHRCAPDSGCCNSETEVCAPIEGRYVHIPFLLHKADGTSVESRMEFFNHTTCACVSRDTLQTSIPVTKPVKTHSVVTPSVSSSEERQNDRQAPPVQATVGPQLDEDVTAPSQIRRCTCPTNFQATTTSGVCTCACGWLEVSRRRDCLYFSRGKEYLGLRDRECIEQKVCAPPVCDYGAYDRRKGKCPKSKKRYHEKRHHQERNVV